MVDGSGYDINFCHNINDIKPSVIQIWLSKNCLKSKGKGRIHSRNEFSLWTNIAWYRLGIILQKPRGKKNGNNTPSKFNWYTTKFSVFEWEFQEQISVFSEFEKQYVDSITIELRKKPVRSDQISPSGCIEWPFNQISQTSAGRQYNDRTKEA